MIIKRVGPVSCAKITGTLYAILGLIGGAFFSLIAMVGGLSSQMPGRSGALTAGLGLGAIIVFPILYGVVGFIATLIGAWLYNVLAGLVGGVQIDVE